MSCCDDADCHQNQEKQEQHVHEHEDEHEHGAGCNHEPQAEVEQLSEDEKQRLRRERIERRRNKNLQTKKKYTPLLKFFKKNGLKFKTAAAGKASVEYFRMDHFKAFLTEKKDAINANPQIVQLLRNWQEIFFYYDRMQNQPHFKWPGQLNISKKGPSSKFASFTFDTAESSKVFSALLLLGVIGLVLFPIWPFWLKYYLWIISYYCTILIIGTIILRLVVYTFCSIFGASVWLFPRLFDNVEILQSFKPFISVNKWEGSNVYSIVTRILILSIFIYYGYHIYADPNTLKQNIQITKTIMDDFNDWGISKIKGEKNFSQSALTDYSKLLNSTLDQNDDEKIVGYTTTTDNEF